MTKRRRLQNQRKAQHRRSRARQQMKIRRKQSHEHALVAIARRATMLPGVLTTTGWQPPDGLSKRQWLTAGESLFAIEGAVQFWIGDWWAYGQHRYRARSQAAKVGALGDRAFSTLANYGWVARAFKTSDRSEVLSWKHHQVLAHLPPDERLQWLRRAESEHWSVAAMLDAMAKPRPALETNSNASVAVSTAPISNEPDHHIERRPAPHCDDRLPKVYSTDDALLTNLNSACAWLGDLVELDELPGMLLRVDYSSEQLRARAMLLNRIADAVEGKTISVTEQEEH
jgi:hypothetical protein